MTTIDDIRERLTEVRPPRSPANILDLGMVQDLTFDRGVVRLRLKPRPMPAEFVNAVVADIKRAVGALDGVSAVDVELERPDPRQEPLGDLGPLPGVRDIVAVSSTKGGVGKSTVAVNLACALSRLGQRVGLLDADIYGPSLPTMVGLSERPRVEGQSRVFPLEKFGLKLMSMGFFVDDSTPVIWRGPLVTGLIRQFLKDVEWGELDVLVIDLPPGTGDAQLTLVQQVPLSGGVVVTTPQEVSLLDVERGIAMFRKVNAPVLGIVENMSYYDCPKCGKRDDVFGTGGGARIAETFGVPLLGQLPLVPEVRASGDAGTPLVVERPDHPVSKVLLDVAAKVLAAVSAQREQVPVPRIVG